MTDARTAELTAAVEEALVPRTHVRALLDACADGIYSIDADGVCRYANPAAAAVLGHHLHDLVGAQLHSLIHHSRPDGSPFPFHECPQRQVVTEGIPFVDEDTIVWRGDGSLIAIEGRSLPVLVDGRVVGAVSKFSDATRRRESDAQLGGMLATTGDGFVGMDHDGTINAWNGAARSLLGWSAEEALGQPLLDLIVPSRLRHEYRDALTRLHELDDAELPLGPVEMRAQHQDGRQIEIELTVGRMRWGGTWRFHAFLRDISGRRAAEVSLARSEALHRLLAENSGDLISQHDPDSTIRYVSPAIACVLGLSPEQVIGTRALDLVHPDDLGTLLHSDGQFRADAGRGELTFRLRHRDGHWVWVEAISSVLRDADGRITEVQMCTRDITDRKARDAEMHRESKLESLGRLSAGLAHEINTPIQYVGDNARFLADAFADLMSMLVLYRGMLDREEPMEWSERQARMREAEEGVEFDYLQEEVPSAVAQTLAGIDRVATIVRAMKTFSHPGHSEHVPADLNEALAATVTVTRHQVSSVADLQLDLGAIPPVRCNIADLNQVFLNLIVNAADAVEETGRRGTIGVSTAVEGEQVVIRISDTGTGIPDHVRAKIFDPFFTTKDVGRGTGQGLPLARAVVQEAHGGTLTVRSEPGAGSTFTVRLPILGARPEEPAAA
ncbi:PAS domain-containing sensor histidine kinase [Modestobacter sp. SYSU DS0511]